MRTYLVIAVIAVVLISLGGAQRFDGPGFRFPDFRRRDSGERHFFDRRHFGERHLFPRRDSGERRFPFDLFRPRPVPWWPIYYSTPTPVPVTASPTNPTPSAPFTTAVTEISTVTPTIVAYTSTSAPVTAAFTDFPSTTTTVTPTIVGSTTTTVEPTATAAAK